MALAMDAECRAWLRCRIFGFEACGTTAEVALCAPSSSRRPDATWSALGEVVAAELTFRKKVFSSILMFQMMFLEFF